MENNIRFEKFQVVRIAYRKTKSSEEVVSSAKEQFEKTGYTDADYILPSGIVDKLKSLIAHCSKAKRPKTEVQDSIFLYEDSLSQSSSSTNNLQTDLSMAEQNLGGPSVNLLPTWTSKIKDSFIQRMPETIKISDRLVLTKECEIIIEYIDGKYVVKCPICQLPRSISVPGKPLQLGAQNLYRHFKEHNSHGSSLNLTTQPTASSTELNMSPPAIHVPTNKKALPKKSTKKQITSTGQSSNNEVI